ncbi:polysaccharide lyase family 7 protein [Azotobacter salinestris]|uniref:polysaccharide lyase family 7 protein n=1 Tax=Azotobacter salinestris TaxID=69964 RepID=UPI00126689BC|nr:polysaccharide lyase family 7 protein [Azotobacter salinestris]
MATIDLTRVNLTTPEAITDGSAKTYWPGEFPENEFFKTLPSGELELWAPTKGASTESTDRTRTEFREIVPGTRTLRNFTLASKPNHYLRSALTMKSLPSTGKTVIGQIHVVNNDRPPLKLFFDNGKIRVGFRKTYNQVDPVNYVILQSVPLNSSFSYSIFASSTRAVKVSVQHGDRAGSIDLSFDSTWDSKNLYFKAGVYNQEDPVATTLLTEGSRAIWHSMELLHY